MLIFFYYKRVIDQIMIAKIIESKTAELPTSFAFLESGWIFFPILSIHASIAVFISSIIKTNKTEQISKILSTEEISKKHAIGIKTIARKNSWRKARSSLKEDFNPEIEFRNAIYIYIIRDVPFFIPLTRTSFVLSRKGRGGDRV